MQDPAPIDTGALEKLGSTPIDPKVPVNNLPTVKTDDTPFGEKYTPPISWSDDLTLFIRGAMRHFGMKWTTEAVLPFSKYTWFFFGAGAVFVIWMLLKLLGLE